MKKLAEAYQVIDGRTVQLASVDVTGELDGGAQTMQNLKATYGTDATYRWHDCYHDENQSCSIVDAS